MADSRKGFRKGTDLRAFRGSILAVEHRAPSLRPKTRPPKSPAPAVEPPDPGSVVERAWAAAPISTDRSARPRAVSFVPRAVFAFGVVPAAICLIGIRYYLLPETERPWSPFHDWLRPSGRVGLAAGYLAFVMFLSMWLYPLRVKFRSLLKGTGSAARWLDVHIVVGLLVPLFSAIHAAWRFEGLIGLGYGSMIIVSASGVVGRYLYVKIPRRQGLELTREDVTKARTEMLREIVSTTGLTAVEVVELLQSVPSKGSGRGAIRTLVHMVRDDLARHRAVNRLVHECRRERPDWPSPDRGTLHRVARMARREMALEQQIRMWDGTRRVFRLWHLVHRPFAILTLIAVGVHVAVAIAFGNAWIG